MHTGVRGDGQLPYVAASPNDDLSSWERLPYNPAIKSFPTELNITNFRDHSVWKDGDSWYQVIGSGIKGIDGTGPLYQSLDFLS